MSKTITERLIAALSKCPCCGERPFKTSGPEDYIPSSYVHETVFLCGARVAVTNRDEFVCTDGCREAVDEKLNEIFWEILEGDEAEQEDIS